MKKLEEYETPETEKAMAILESLGFKEKGWYATGKLAEHSRDLERKLAMCREALREIANTQATRANIGWMIPADIRDDAEETFKATEPK